MFYLKIWSKKKIILLRKTSHPHALNSGFNNTNYHAVVEYINRIPKNKIYEDHVSRLTSIILPYYFNYDTWFISPEQVWGQNWRPDYTIWKVNLTQGPYFGKSIAHVLVEIKRPVSSGGLSWHKLLEQGWDQADSAKNTDGKLWFIGQRGFEFCVFRFDVFNYPSNIEGYTNFMPLNLHNWTKQDFDHMNIDVITETVNNVEVIRIIKWRLDDKTHAMFLHEMLSYIESHNP